MNRKQRDGDERQPGRWVKSAAVYSALVFALPSCVLGGFLLGDWLDGKLGTRPWMMLIGLLLGSAAGFHQMYRILFSRKS